ncbi:MAG: hypothetical protein KDD44_00460, partial [Bdellovibrionales bacterium]|nr:hypothetical protein [Bdellovibrionales bacterium]
SAPTVNCLQAWNVAYVGLHRIAMRAVDKALRDATTQGLDPQALLDDWLQVSGQAAGDDPNLPVNLYKVVAKHVLANEQNNSTRATFISKFVNRTSHFRVLGVSDESDLSFAERTRLGPREYEARTQLMTTASSLPYYQGLALYFLSVCYPFFALLLLVPGYHSAFLMWFLLWFWAKSWDIGFSVVMLLDDVLFSMFVARNFDFPAATSVTNRVLDENALQKDLSLAITALREGDPTFQLGTYYGLLGIAIQSIPIISSYLILGGLRAGSGLINRGQQLYASEIARGSADYRGQEGLNQVRSAALQHQMATAQSYIAAQKAGLLNSPISGGGTRGDTGISMSGTRSTNFMGMSLDGQQGVVKWGKGIGGFAQGFQHGGLRGAASKAVDAGWSWGTRGSGGQGQGTGKTDGAKQKQNAYNRRKRQNPGAPGKPSKNVVAWTGVAVGAVGKVATAAGNAMQGIRDEELSRHAAWAKFDSTNSHLTQTRSAIARLYGAIEIPWTEDGAYDNEFKKATSIIKGYESIIQSGLAAAKDVTTRVIKGDPD